MVFISPSFIQRTSGAFGCIFLCHVFCGWQILPAQTGSILPAQTGRISCSPSRPTFRPVPSDVGASFGVGTERIGDTSLKLTAAVAKRTRKTLTKNFLFLRHGRNGSRLIFMPLINQLSITVLVPAPDSTGHQLRLVEAQ